MQPTYVSLLREVYRENFKEEMKRGKPIVLVDKDLRSGLA